jgi:hypothetical protein
MPQKDETRHCRAATREAARVIGDVVDAADDRKGLTLAYNKDLQETQEPFYDRLNRAGQPGRGAGIDRIAGVRPPDRMQAAAQENPALGAIPDSRRELVRNGSPFSRGARDRRPSGPEKPRKKGVTPAVRLDVRRVSGRCPLPADGLGDEGPGTGARAVARPNRASGAPRAEAVEREVALVVGPS